MEEEMDSIMMEKREAVDKKDYRKATSLRERERVLEEKLSVERNQWYEIQKKNKKEVNADTVAEVVSMITSVPVSRVSESETQRLLNMAEMLKKKLIGQDSAIDAMVRAIHRNRAG
jgi:ATP-dependent Clp protease ATP-binding subunit ClpC